MGAAKTQESILCNEVTAFERSENPFSKNFCLKAKARIWLWLSCMCQTRSTAAVQTLSLKEQRFILKLSGNEVYCTNALPLLMKIMLCSKLHRQKVVDWNRFPISLDHWSLWNPCEQSRRWSSKSSSTESGLRCAPEPTSVGYKRNLVHKKPLHPRTLLLLQKLVVA